MLNTSNKKTSKTKRSIPAILWGLFLLYATLKPSDGVNHFPLWLRKLHPDKIEHFVAWFIWYWIFSKSYLFGVSKEKIYNMAIKFIAFASFFGIIIEILQYSLHWGRSAEWLDWLADTLGLVFGFVVFSL